MIFVVLTKDSENASEVRYTLETTTVTKTFTDENNHTRELGAATIGKGVFHKDSKKWSFETPTDGFFLTADAQSTIEAIENELAEIAKNHTQFPSMLTIRG